MNLGTILSGKLPGLKKGVPIIIWTEKHGIQGDVEEITKKYFQVGYGSDAVRFYFKRNDKVDLIEIRGRSEDGRKYTRMRKYEENDKITEIKILKNG